MGNLWTPNIGYNVKFTSHTINENIQVPDPVDANIFDMDAEQLDAHRVKVLPGSMGEAIKGFRDSEMMRRALGDHIFEKFLEAKVKEWNSYRAQVHAWELSAYLAAY